MFCRKEKKQRKDKCNYLVIEAKYGGGERRVQDFGGKTWGKETTGETQA